jgi:phage major head subunit gpT-like protein
MAAITSGFLTALHSDFKTDFANGQARAEAEWARIASEIKSTSAKNTYGWLGKFPNLREWVGDRVINDMKAHAYEIANKSYEGTVGIDRDDIEDDELGTYGPMMEEMGYAEKAQVDELVFGLLKNGDANLCYDGQNFFDTDHPVYPNHDGTGVAATVSNYTAGAGDAWYLLCTKRPLKPLIYQNRRAAEFVTKFDPRNSDHVYMSKEFLWGVDCRRAVGYGFWQFAYRSEAALNSDNLQAAYEAMMGFKGDGGKPLGVKPDLLVVPPSLDGAATVAVKNMFDAAGASNKTYQKVDTLTSPWLD